MDLRLHNAIAARLEACKSGGWLSDYLVAWHGPSGRLSPNITVWPAADRTEAEVKMHLTGLLTGIVAAANIVVEADVI